MRLRSLALALAAGVAGLALPATAQDLVVGQTSEHDAFVATADDWPLYMFDKDARAAGGHPAKSTCHDACAEAWPPLTVEGGGEPEVGDGLDPQLVGTFERRDGSTQVTYAGWPLYRYFRDQREVYDTHGQALHTHGGLWYLLTPDGELITERRY